MMSMIFGEDDEYKYSADNSEDDGYKQNNY